jgi:hypothetical protein
MGYSIDKLMLEIIDGEIDYTVNRRWGRKINRHISHGERNKEGDAIGIGFIRKYTRDSDQKRSRKVSRKV